MRIIELYIDFGTGFEITNPAISGTIGQKNDINQFIYRKFTELECVFFGNDYDKLKTAIDNGTIKLPYKVKLYNVSTQLYEDFCTGDVFIRQNLDFERKTITLSSFIVIDEYSPLIKIGDFSINVCFLTEKADKLQLKVVNVYDSAFMNIPVIVDSASVSVNDYKNAYNPDGTTGTGTASTDWNYFIYSSTEIISGTLVKYWFSAWRSLLKFNMTETINFDGSVIYVLIDPTVPTTPPTTLYLTSVNDSVTVKKALEALINFLSFELSGYTVPNDFIVNTGYTITFTDTNTISLDGIAKKHGSVSMSINDIFTILSGMYNYFYYLDSLQIKFEYIGEFINTTELFDLATIFQRDLNKGNSKITYLDAESVNVEIFSTQNATSEDFTSLRVVYDNPFQSVNELNIDVIADLKGLLNDSNSTNNYLIAESLDITGNTIAVDNTGTVDTTIQNSKCAWYSLFIYDAGLRNFRPFNSAYIPLSGMGANTELNTTVGKAKAVQSVETYLLDEITTNFRQKHITTDIGNAIIKSASLDILSGKILWQLEYYD